MSESSGPPPLPPGSPGQAQDPSESLGMRMLLPVGRSGFAIAAGYLGLFAFIILPAPLALVFGALGIWDIRRSNARGNKKYGMGRAIFGLVMGILGTGVLILFVVAALSE